MTKGLPTRRALTAVGRCRTLALLSPSGTARGKPATCGLSDRSQHEDDVNNVVPGLTGAALLGAVLGLFVLVALVVAPRNKRPSSALAWILLITFLPVLGLVLFCLSAVQSRPGVVENAARAPRREVGAAARIRSKRHERLGALAPRGPLHVL